MMKSILAAASLASVWLPSAADAQVQKTSSRQGVPLVQIDHKSELKTIDGPAEYFTGKVTITGQFQRPDPSRVGGAIVRFEPGARTAWHAHPAGQTLIVTEGVGWTQIEGGPKLEFRAGDILWCPAEHKHWHGATPRDAMTHIAIQESVNGTPVTWMEKVTEEQYLAPLGEPKA
ncbi:(R)-mandelonitrile lyase [Sphingomonas sanxanigenens]|uniref:(R)-mandelonitrile lyase n=1 Tax=Sphingomonas sanxanigenens TaxID=397260 RepID=UPI000A013B49|nr:cupin domain-containing protein [Sphingomonas sanxanigenens]